jgi:hypothetical protein
VGDYARLASLMMACTNTTQLRAANLPGRIGRSRPTASRAIPCAAENA